MQLGMKNAHSVDPGDGVLSERLTYLFLFVDFQASDKRMALESTAMQPEYPVLVYFHYP